MNKISTINTNNIDVSKNTTLVNTSNTDNIYSIINTTKTRTMWKRQKVQKLLW